MLDPVAGASLSRPSRIAIIDDDSSFLQLMQDLLGTDEGYQVFTSMSWASSFEFVRSVQPDLLMLDLMRGHDQVGWAVLDLLRADPTTQALPVLLCSAAPLELPGFAGRMRSMSAVECVAKPFDVDDLLQTIERMLARSTISATIADHSLTPR
jgi:CheY-like chemotaxis protein